MDKLKIIEILLFSYIVSIGFIEVINLPAIGAKLQPPEFIFVCAAIFWFLLKAKNLSQVFNGFGKLETAILIYVFVVLFNAVLANNLKGWFELLGIIYLALLFLLFRWFLIQKKNPFKFINSAFVACGTIASLSGILGWVLAQFDIENPMAWSSEIYYPYLGYIGRAQGFSTTPNMLHSLLGTCFIWGLVDAFKRPTLEFSRKICLLIIAIGIVLTFAKTILLLVIGGLVIWCISTQYHRKQIRGFVFVISCFLFGICMIGSHIMLVNEHTVKWAEIKKMAYAEEIPFARFSKDYSLVKTCYLVNKESAFQAGVRNFPIGVGPGGHNEFVGRLKEEGLYPNFFSNYDPHSTYWGAFAEIGIVGLIALAYLYYQIFLNVKRYLIRAVCEDKWMYVALSGCFIYAAMEAIVTDIMNFRHYWVLLGILGAILFVSQENEFRSSKI